MHLAKAKAVRRKLQIHLLLHCRRLAHSGVGEVQMANPALLIPKAPPAARPLAVRIEPTLGAAASGQW